MLSAPPGSLDADVIPRTLADPYRLLPVSPAWDVLSIGGGFEGGEVAVCESCCTVEANPIMSCSTVSSVLWLLHTAVLLYG